MSTNETTGCVKNSFDGQTILVTGATGLLGTALIRTLLHEYKATRIVALSRGEFRQFQLQSQLSTEELKRVRFFIGDVRDIDRLKMAFRGVDVIIHAATQRRVEYAEYNPFECVHTNIVGAENVVQAAIDADVSKVIAVSSAAAVDPVSMYGASMLASEKIFVAANALASGADTMFSVIRLGEILDSNSDLVQSVVQRPKNPKKPLNFSVEGMTRFCLPLGKACDAVISAISRISRGDIVVPKMQSIHLDDLIKVLAPGLSAGSLGQQLDRRLHMSLIECQNYKLIENFPDRYVIKPDSVFWELDESDALAGQVMAEGFRYASNTSEDWIDIQAIEEILRDGS